MVWCHSDPDVSGEESVTIPLKDGFFSHSSLKESFRMTIVNNFMNEFCCQAVITVVEL